MTFHRNPWLLGAGALMLTLGLGATALSAQNTPPAPPNGPRPFMGRGMGPGGPGGPGGPFEMFMGRAAERLGLTDVQQSQIKGILDGHRTDLETIMKGVGDARRALVAAQLAGQGDDQVVQASALVAKAEAGAAVTEAHIIAEIMQVLNTDQQNQVKQFAQNPPRPGGRRNK